MHFSKIWQLILRCIHDFYSIDFTGTENLLWKSHQSYHFLQLYILNEDNNIIDVLPFLQSLTKADYVGFWEWFHLVEVLGLTSLDLVQKYDAATNYQ